MGEYAPEYTKKERLLILARHSIWVVPLFVMTQFWFLPWFEVYAKKAHCFDYGHFTGIHVVFYFVFVAIPVGAALILFVIEGPRCIRVIRLEQNPLPGEKVLRRTKYKYGWRAKVQPYILLFCLLLLLGLGIKGIFWANEIIKYSTAHSLSC